MGITPQHNSNERRRRVLNLQALMIVAVCLAVVHFGVKRLHGRHVVQTTSYLKTAGLEALDQGENQTAFNLLQQYLLFNGGDSEVRATVSRLLGDQTHDRDALIQAFNINEHLLISDKSNHDLRLRQAQVAIQLDRLSDAQDHLERLQESLPQAAVVWHLSGIVSEKLADIETAASCFEHATTLPDCTEASYQQLVSLLVSADRSGKAVKVSTDRAEELLNHMVSRFKSTESLRIRAEWLLSEQRYSEALADLWQAAEESPDDLSVMQLLVRTTQKQFHHDSSVEARASQLQLIAHLRTRIETRPDITALRRWLSVLLWQAGQQKEAVALLNSSLAAAPDDLRMRTILFDYLIELNQVQSAEQIADHLPQRSLNRGLTEYMHGRLLMVQQHWSEAIDAFDMAAGLAADDEYIVARSYMNQAQCRARTGDINAARETYRTVVQAHPDSDSGRLGVAASYVESNQLALAIAEYRQLLHVEEVPAYLANLLIEWNLTQPLSNRDWTEADRLVSDDDPLVKDEVQRILLQADLLFAKGYPASALKLLDAATASASDRPELRQAVHRVTVKEAALLQQTLTTTITLDPENLEAHVARLRLLAADTDPAAITAWLQQLSAGQEFAKRQSVDRHTTIVKAIETTLDDFPEAFGPSHRMALQKAAEHAYEQVALQIPGTWPAFAAFLARSHGATAAIERFQNTDTPLPTDIQAACWVECLRVQTSQPALQARVQEALRDLIVREPGSIALRLTFADYLILVDQRTDAAVVLQQLLDYDATNIVAINRLAWLLAHDSDRRAEALSLSDTAIQLNGSDTDVRTVRGLVLSVTGDTQAATRVLRSLPDDQRTIAARVYEAHALQAAGKTAEAAGILASLPTERIESHLAPADLNLLRTLRQTLTAPST
jgi:tetratricopeptide (TPR) repeat protein